MRGETGGSDSKNGTEDPLPPSSSSPFHLKKEKIPPGHFMGNCFSMEKYYPVPVVAPNTFVLKLINNCKCQGCEGKLMKIKELVQKIQGVHSTSIDAKTWQVTISGTVDPQQVIWVLKRKAGLLLEEIPSMKKKHEIQRKTLSLPVDQEFNVQNLVAKVLGIEDNEGGLKELEITIKATFNGKNKDGMILKSDTHKKIVVDDDNDRGPKSQGHVHNSFDSRHLDLGPKSQGHVHNFNYSHCGNYTPPPAGRAPSGGPPPKPETPWQGNYFPPPEPVASCEPSAPPSYGYPYFWSS